MGMPLGCEIPAIPRKNWPTAARLSP